MKLRILQVVIAFLLGGLIWLPAWINERRINSQKNDNPAIEPVVLWNGWKIENQIPNNCPQCGTSILSYFSGPEQNRWSCDKCGRSWKSDGTNSTVFGYYRSTFGSVRNQDQNGKTNMFWMPGFRSVTIERKLQ